MKLYLYPPGALLIFVEPLTPPAAEPDARPWLTDVSGYSVAARSSAFRSAGATESASITVELDNRERQASLLIRNPARNWAEVYNDDGTLYFAGLVQGAEYGTSVKMNVEA